MPIPYLERKNTVRILAGVEVKPSYGSSYCSRIEFTVDAEPIRDSRSADVVMFRTPFYYDDVEVYKAYVIICSQDGEWAVYVRWYDNDRSKVIAPKRSVDVHPLTYTALRKETDGHYWFQVDIPEVLGAIYEATGVSIGC